MPSLIFKRKIQNPTFHLLKGGIFTYFLICLLPYRVFCTLAFPPPA